MSATAWGAVVDALLTAVAARPGYRSTWDATTANATDRVVLDSIEVGQLGDQAGTFLVVAFPGDPALPIEAGQTGQVVATLPNPRTRQEDGLVRCLAVDQRGDVGPGVTSASRVAALSVLDDVDATLRAAPTLGLVPIYASMVVRLGGLPSIRPFLGSGVVTWVEFDVEFSARI